MILYNFIKKRPYLVWYTRNFKEISSNAIVESVLNYGTFDDVQKIIAILGMKRVAVIFRKQLRHKRINYDAKTMNYFKLYFKKYA